MKNLFSYEGKRVVLAGAGSGMGEATARVVSALGAGEVVAIDLDYAGVPSQQSLVLSRLALRREDGAGHLIKKGPKDVNPVSFEFRNYRF